MNTSLLLPAISAGTPLPIDDLPCERFDVEAYLLPHPRNSLYVQVNGDSMIDRGIYDGDILVVDKSLQPRQGSVVVAQVNGDYTIKTYESRDGRLRLVPANAAYSPLEPSEGTLLCGVATFVIHRL